MNKINNKTVTVSTSSELKEALEQNNCYEYIYLENDITLNSGITINSKKSKITINGTYQNTMHTLTGMNSSEATDTIISTALTKEVQIKNMKIIRQNIAIYKNKKRHNNCTYKCRCIIAGAVSEHCIRKHYKADKHNEESPINQCRFSLGIFQIVQIHVI